MHLDDLTPGRTVWYVDPETYEVEMVSVGDKPHRPAGLASGLDHVQVRRQSYDDTVPAHLVFPDRLGAIAFLRSILDRDDEGAVEHRHRIAQARQRLAALPGRVAELTGVEQTHDLGDPIA